MMKAIGISGGFLFEAYELFCEIYSAIYSDIYSDNSGTVPADDGYKVFGS